MDVFGLREGEPPVAQYMRVVLGMLILIAVEVAVLLVLFAAAVVAFLDVARRVTAALRRIEAHTEADSNETLPAIRNAVSDVVNVLVPPTDRGQR